MEFKENMTCEEFFKTAQEIYNCLEDEESRELFKKRMEVATVGLDNISKSGFIKKYNKSYWEKKDFNNAFNNLELIFGNIPKEETVIFYGAGYIAERIMQLFNISFKNYPNILFCDKMAISKNDFLGFPLISIDTLVKKYSKNKIIITTYDHKEEVYKLLIDNNINEKNIINKLSEINYKFLFELEKYVVYTYKMFDNIELPDNYEFGLDSEVQYFDEMITYKENEVFVDAGVLNGDTSFNFIKNCSNYAKIYMFEPTLESYIDTQNNIKNRKLENIELYNVGLWNKKDELKFKTNELIPASNLISEHGDVVVNVDSLDNFFINNNDANILPPTFIKMDIQGAELAALQGGAETIKQYKPKLAISIYHKPEDIIEIPAFIKSLVPEYKLYIRHYTNTHTETILYAL